MRRHPVQLYETIGLLAVSALVWRMIDRGAQPAAPFLTALAGYGLTIWFVEAFRAAETTAIMFGGLRVMQVVGLVLALAALVGFRSLATAANVGSDEPASET